MQRGGVILFVFASLSACIAGDISPAEIQFTRQAARRLVFDRTQEIALWSLRPDDIVGLDIMHPAVTLDETAPARYAIEKGVLKIRAEKPSRSALWAGGMNPFAGHVLEIEALGGDGMAGFDFASPDGAERLSVLLTFNNGTPVSTLCVVMREGKEVFRKILHDLSKSELVPPFQFRVQMLGAGATVFVQKEGLPRAAGQLDGINAFLDLRRKEAIRSYQTRVLTDLQADGEVVVRQARAVIDTGAGLADMRAMTRRDGRPLLENGRVYYTMSIRGRTLPQHIQGVFSMDPSVFDLRLEGIILFDRGDGLLRNEIASHIFYDDRAEEWRGVTTGFTSYADPQKKEQKEILAVRSRKDPRFGISVMKAVPMGLVGNYEDAHVVYDAGAEKWRMLLCENHEGYKAVVRQSDRWDGGYERVSGPVGVDSTGTMIQKIGDTRYCLFGSAARALFVYSYPDLKPLGQLRMDLPPWSATSGTRVWANLIPLPEGYPSRYVLLTMDRMNYPGFEGPNWSYGALYLYHGHRPDGDGHPYEYE